MSFDVGRWNLVKTTLGSLDLVRTILRTHQVEITESPAHNTDHQDLDPGRRKPEIKKILLQQNKKRRGSGKKCHARNYDAQ